MSETKKINTEQFIKFRDTSIYFYMFSFFCMTAFFIMYLYANKNNRLCQYGSTLFCNTEQKYPLAQGADSGINDAIQLTFQTNFIAPQGSIYTIKFPYQNNNYYNIDYYFGIPGGDDVKLYSGNIGLSFNGAVGASFYYQANQAPFASLLANWTTVILQNANPEFIINLPNKQGNDNVIEYYYVSLSENNLENIIVPSTSPKIASSQLIGKDNAEPISDSWMNLLRNIQTQHKQGCRTGNRNGCACIDPSFITPKLCDQLVLNKSTGIYCPPNNLNCSLCSGDDSDSNDCGYRFCRASNNNIIGANDETSNTYTRPSSTQQGYYQNTYVPGIKDKTSGGPYKRGAGGKTLTDLLSLEEISSSNPANTAFSNIGTLQNLNFCAGTSPTNNNYDNSPINDNGKVDISGNEITALYAIYPTWDSNGAFDFNT